MRRLVIRPGGIGDCILSLPALRAVTGNKTEVWTLAACAPLMPFAGRVQSATATGLFLVGFDLLLPSTLEAALRSFDEIISWYGMRDPRVRQQLSMIHPNIRFLDTTPSPGYAGHMLDFFNAQASELTGEAVSGMPFVEAC